MHNRRGSHLKTGYHSIVMVLPEASCIIDDSRKPSKDRSLSKYSLTCGSMHNQRGSYPRTGYCLIAIVLSEVLSISDDSCLEEAITRVRV